jgi:hypothetical protein
MKYVKKEIVEAYTFEEFIKYGIDSGAELVNGMPWTFDFYGVQVTHENDTSYIVGGFIFTSSSMLVIKNDYDPNEDVYPFESWNKEAFMALHHPSLESLQKKIKDDMDHLTGRKGSRQ